MAEETIRRGLLLRTAAEVLRDADRPLRAAEALSRVADRLDLSPVELSRNDSGVPRFETYVRFGSTWMSSLGWLKKANRTWELTPAGLEALNAHAGDAFDREVARRYQRLQRERRATAELVVDPQTQLLREAVLSVTAGSWTSTADLAALSGLDVTNVAQRLATLADVPRHRVVADGRLSDEQRTTLADEGVTVDEDGELPAEQQLSAEELRGLVGPPATGRRAWLVRGSAVSGMNVVPQWLADGFVSLAAAHLNPVTPGTALDELRALVERDYAHLSYHQRQAKLAELHAFLNRMQTGDLVATTAEGTLHLGRIAGDAEFTPTTETRTTIRRTVEWDPAGHDFGGLDESLQARLRTTATVTDLTDALEDLEVLTAVDTPQVVPPRAARQVPLPDLDDATVDRLLVGPDWLHEFVDLLRTRRQVILHGPPGTGKTYLALHVAERLTDPANVALVQFHPAYSYEDFFEGYRPTTVDDSGRVGFALTPGPFRKIVDVAKQNLDQNYVLIIDEINRANLAKVFGELYFLLEYRDRAIDLMYSSGDEGRDFTLPPNVYIVGTMNTADRSIALVDAAMRRRFAFLSLHPDDAHLRGVLRGWLAREGMSGEPADLLDELNSRVPDRDFKIGPSYLMRREVGTETGLDRIWRTSILPLLEEFHYGEAGFDVAARYGLAALRKSLSTDTDEPDL